jgi:ectoine hydroxylase-related dioxygenase (phytanoyl-CoA dioxygenase family)
VRGVLSFLAGRSRGAGFVRAPATAAERRRAYEEDGFVAGGPLLDDEECRTLRLEFDRLFAEGHETVPVRGGRQFHKVYDLHRRSAAFAAVVTHPGLAERLAEITGLDALRVLLDQVQYKPPRVGGRNAWHRDQPSFPLAPPCTALTAWIALDDATERTGCMRMVPGSHRFGEPSDLAFEGDGWGLAGVDGLSAYRGHPVRVVTRPVAAGHVHFHHAAVWHASGGNATRRPRRAFAVLYVGEDDRYRGSRWTRLEGLRDGDPLDAAAPLVVRRPS